MNLFSKKLILLMSIMNTLQAMTLNEKNGTTQFIAIGKPAMLKIHGEGLGPSGEIKLTGKTINGDIYVDLQSLNTGLSLRDEHMKNKYLQTNTYQKAKMNLSGVTLPAELNSINSNIKDQKFSALLSLHGIDKPIEGQYSLTPEEKKVKIVAKFSLKLSEFGIDIPSYAGVKIADTVDVETNFEVDK